MADVGMIGGISIAYIDLNAPRISDAGMNEAHPIDYRADEFYLLLKSSIDHLQARIPVGEIAIDFQLGEAFD